MASNEYAELEQRYNMLRAQHLELTNLASVYADIIRGSPAIGREATSLEQLRAEAGQEGLRAYVLGRLFPIKANTDCRNKVRRSRLPSFVP